MAKGKRKLQEATAHFNPASDGTYTVDRDRIAEELLLMIRMRMNVSRNAGMSKVRLELIPFGHAEFLVDMLELFTR